MIGFADEVYIDVASGNGGHGCVSFRREKYVPKGGPNGGDGGDGGSVIFEVRQNLKTLAHLKNKRQYKAQNGEPGKGKQRHGKNGSDVIIPIPPGTLIKDPESGKILCDLTDENERWIMFQGGHGGKGNMHFATSRRQVPRYAQPGEPGIEKRLHVELHIIADIGFVGLPNAGKSSLLSVITNAHPKIAAYAFTTKVPNLGVLRYNYRDIILADIPGIIEGAAHGAGLGDKFLKHISRTKGLAILIDLSDDDVLHTYDIVLSELRQYTPELIKKPRVVVGNKLDLPDTAENLEFLRANVGDVEVIGISTFSSDGIEKVKEAFYDLVHSHSDENGHSDEGESVQDGTS